MITRITFHLACIARKLAARMRSPFGAPHKPIVFHLRGIVREFAY